MLFFKYALILWLLGALAGLCKWPTGSKCALQCGIVLAFCGAMLALPKGLVAAALPMHLANQPVSFSLNGAALWFLIFGLLPAFLAIWVHRGREQSTWLAATNIALIGALGVFGVQDGVSFFIAWELMSFGVAVMLLAEHRTSGAAASIFFMLALLEVGAIAVLMAFLLLSDHGTSLQFAEFAAHAATFSMSKRLVIGLLLLVGFGAKLGLIPFYEWLPKAYAAGSGCSGAIASGIILNAAFFALMRSLIVWLPGTDYLSTIVMIVAVLTAMLTILCAFQQRDWRQLLSYSTAENGAISVLTLGVSLLFQQEHQADLAAMAAVVAIIHLSGHSLAKGALFMVADGVHQATGSYVIRQNGLIKQIGWFFGLGALLAVMSMSSMPPSMGFVTEWYVFQSIFHGFLLHDDAGRYALIATGAGLALTAAIALATFVKAFGVGLLGNTCQPSHPVSLRLKVAVLILGLTLLITPVSLVYSMDALSTVMLKWFHVDAPNLMHSGLLLVPLSANFAFISPLLLVIVCPLLALLPIALIVLNKRYPVKRSAIWYGGLPANPKTVATTALTFANALHYFYRLVYLPKHEVSFEYNGKPYFIKRVSFHHESTALFNRYVFTPIVQGVSQLADKIRLLQSGSLNFYNAIIGVLLIVILLSVFWW